MCLLRTALFLLLLSPGCLVNADYFAVPLNKSDWQTQHSKILCGLQQRVDGLGSIGFVQPAGEPLQFYYQELNPQHKIRKAGLFVASAPWQNKLVYQQDYPVFLDQENKRLVVNGDVAETMLEALRDGNYPVFSIVRARESRVAASAVNFSVAYRQFIECRNTLLPFSKQQLEQDSFYFYQSGRQLSRSQVERLRQIAGYLLEMTTTEAVVVSATHVAGKADSAWFQKRAIIISRQLIRFGVAAERIMTAADSASQAHRDALRIQVFGPEALSLYFFRKGNLRLTALEKKRLKLLAIYIKNYFHRGQVVINSYTDSKGSRSRNLNITRQRSNVFRNFLVAQGVDPDRIKVRAYGESRPFKSNRFPPGRAQNRRVVIRLNAS